MEALKRLVVGHGTPTIALAVRWLPGYTGKSSGGLPRATTIGRWLEDVALAARLLKSLRDDDEMR